MGIWYFRWYQWKSFWDHIAAVLNIEYLFWTISWNNILLFLGSKIMSLSKIYNVVQMILISHTPSICPVFEPIDLCYFGFSPHNLPSFRACSQMLGSLSSYQYTRKAWKKEAFELLLDSSFFQMDETCLVYWRTVIDNLMTHDKTTFKDLLSKLLAIQLIIASFFLIVV